MTRIMSITAALLLTTTVTNAATIALTYQKSGKPAISIKGEIEQGDYAKFLNVEAAIVGNQKAFVYLDSIGGTVADGLAVAKRIRSQQYETVVFNNCASMCAIAWLAGYRHWVAEGARIGFHAVYYTDKDGKNPKVSPGGNAVIGAFLSRLGYDDSAIRKLTEVEPNEPVFLLNGEKAKQLGISIDLINKR